MQLTYIVFQVLIYNRNNWLRELLNILENTIVRFDSNKILT